MLTEREIFDQMMTSLRGAADDCDIIARQPVSGPIFDRMRKRLKLVEGCCRQAAHWREDTRWLQPGLMMEAAHQKAREWLHRPSIASKKLFVGLAAVLRKWERDIAVLRTQATGRSGIILPRQQHAPRTRSFIQVPGFAATSSGLIVPDRLQ